MAPSHRIDWFRRAAADTDGGEPARREALAVLSHVLAMRSALNWCAAAEVTHAHGPEAAALQPILACEVQITREFWALYREHPWLWDNACWHPHYTVLSQRIPGLGPDLQVPGADAFAVKLALMRAEQLSATDEGAAEEEQQLELENA